MEHFHDDEITTVKSGLFIRLLQYARPYWRALLLAVLAMSIATVLDLIRPYLLKIAVDDYITGYEKPMIETESESYDLRFRNKNYVYRENPSDIDETYNLMADGNDYYFGKTDETKEHRIKINEEE